MREILFRGKRTDNGEWVYGFYAKSGDKTFIIVDNDIAVGYVTMKEVIPDTVGQYTGLTDKNGTRIFEGDIVKLFLVDCTEIGVIKFNDIMCRFMFYDKSGGYGFDNTTPFEVIGNIHDNPALLKGGDDQ